jgi:hypothetical protein
MVKKLISTLVIAVLALPLGVAFAVAGFAAGVLAMGHALRDVWKQ